MSWHYQEGDKAAGPVAEDQLLQFFEDGKIDSETLVWKSGTESWLRFREAFPSHGRTTPPKLKTNAALTGETCVECRMRFPEEDLVAIQGQTVCGGCKAFVIQKIREGIVLGSDRGWRDGKLMVVVDGMELPNQCVKCGSHEGVSRKAKKFYWHPTWVFLLLLLNVLIALIAALLTRKKVKLGCSLCSQHRQRNLIGQLIGGLCIAGGIAGVIWAGIDSSAIVGVMAVLVLIAGITFVLTWGRVVVIRKIKNQRAWLHGVDPTLVDSLPEWNNE